MGYDMKISFDVYTRHLDKATEAYAKLDAVCNESLRLGKGKRYNSDLVHYNVYGSIDTEEVSVLHNAFKDGFVDDSDDV
tara:strand:+ start:219 stop:455 length:237 start_codon:yes stop_codon:yes gene_type:complete